MAKKIKRCGTNTPLLVAVGVAGALEVIMVAQNPPQNWYLVTLLGLPITLGAAAGAYLVTRLVCG